MTTMMTRYGLICFMGILFESSSILALKTSATQQMESIAKNATGSTVVAEEDQHDVGMLRGGGSKQKRQWFSDAEVDYRDPDQDQSNNVADGDDDDDDDYDYYDPTDYYYSYDNSAQESIALSWAKTAAMYDGRNNNDTSYYRMDTTVQGERRRRSLQSFDNHRFMKPSCTKGCELSRTWTQMGYRPSSGMVIIQCGHCITLDTQGLLVLSNGIDIRGRFEIPNENAVEIETPFIRVQGILKMRAARRVDGKPRIKVTLTGNNAASFVPQAPNTYACTDTNSGEPKPCNAGSQAIVAAGGKFDIYGLPETCKTWVKLHDVLSPPSNIVVQSSGVGDCWRAGAEILITSHTIVLADADVYRLVSDPQPYGSGGGLVKLTLERSIETPTVSVTDGDGFAVEVALLSRNIKFTSVGGGSDKGGHLMVMQTPDQNQLIDGIEFDNFGRLGELGRYPIHMHMCNDMEGAVISRNTIRNSNQRCVVIHGSHSVRIEENVAYETMGHCYLTEDGGETNNKFINNLGASTRAATKTVRSGESDKSNPSTFWCSNPSNTWEGNVAAGSVAFGYWFELPKGVKEPTKYMEKSYGMTPHRMNLGIFLDNVAHSNRKQGFKLYPHGYEPSRIAVFQNTKSYKNNLDGLKFHRSKNVEVRGGVVADNRVGIDYDEIDYFTLRGVTIIGLSKRYKEIVDDYFGVNVAQNDRVQGIELHTYTRFGSDYTSKAATIVDCKFQGFGYTFAGEDDTALINIDSTQDTSNGYFNAWATVSGMTIDGGSSNMPSNAFDFINSENSGIKNLFLIDLDGSMEPGRNAATKTGQPGAIIGDNSDMKAFIDVNTKCVSGTGYKKYLYCRRLCLRAISFYASVGNGIRLRITNKSTGKSYEYNGISEDGRRFYSAVLPPGNYRVAFVNGSGTINPGSVTTRLEPALCDGAIQLNNIETVSFSK